MTPNAIEALLAAFMQGDLEAARAYIDSNPAIGRHDGYEAHPLLREFVARNCGHCYKASHRAIADLLIPVRVRSFRDDVMADRVEGVRAQLVADPKLARAEFTGGRGIAQAIHHWRSIPVAALLLDIGADVDALTTVGCAGETPLMMQLRFGTLEGAGFLLERGADPNLGGLKHTPSASMADGLNLLLQYGWDINEQVGCRTLLHHDANHGHGGRIRLLLKHGADPNIRDAEGRTALHLVSARGTGSEAIRDLVEAGTQVDARDQAGKTPLDYAESARSQVAARALMALGATASEPMDKTIAQE